MASEPTEDRKGNERPAEPDRTRGGEEPTRNTPFLMMALVASLALLFLYYAQTRNAGDAVEYSFFLKELELNENVASVKIRGTALSGKWKKPPVEPADAAGEPGRQLGAEFQTEIPLFEDRTLLDRLEKEHVDVTVITSSPNVFAEMLMWMLPVLVMVGFLWLLLRRTSDPFSSGMFGSFIRSPAKRFRASEQKNTFDDVAGMEHAKRELQEVVEFLKDPAKFQRLGAQIPKGVLLMGPPGTGKTLMARATAGEAGVPFFSINGSEFIQMFVGVGASRVRDMFRTAKEAAPSILFVDEIDAVGRVRGAGVGGGHDEREQTLNQILSEMDGFQQTEAVIVIAATNRPDVLDPALLRPGRFDRHVTVERPTREGRVGVLKVHSRKVPLSDNVDLDEVAAGTIGFSGADLKNLVNEAALNATREGKNAVDRDDFDAARDKILMGAKREEILNEHERQMTAYHEAGHALLAWLLPEVDSVHKVTIIPRGRALGVTQLLPEEERFHIGEKRLHSELAVALAGRAAEKLVFDEYSAGAEDDLRRATQIARRMIGSWGMSEVIGPAAFRQGEEHPFLGKEMHEQRQFSEETAHAIDVEIQRFLNGAHERATQLLQDEREKLSKVADGLLNKEMLGRDELTELIGPPVDRNYVRPRSAAEPAAAPLESLE